MTQPLATLKSIEQLTAEIQKSNNLLEMISKNIQLATTAMYGAQIMAAKIQSSKTDYERNNYVKDAQNCVEALGQSFEEVNNEYEKRQADPQSSQA